MNRSTASVAAVMALLLACGSTMAAGNRPTVLSDSSDDIVLGGGSSKAMTVATVKGKSSAVTGGIQTWAVETKDINLANTFQRWAAQAGWRVRWDAAKHVMVEAPNTVTGTFEEAVEAQLASPGIAMSAYPLEVCFYPNTPPLARVTRKGDQSLECK